MKINWKDAQRQRRRQSRGRHRSSRFSAVTVGVVLSVGIAIAAGSAANEHEQLGGIGSAVKRAQQLRELQVSDAEEQQIGAGVSERVRARYGVVQDANVHRYVTLVGTAVAEAAGKPNVPWQFIVLDTDAVNAFATPGGFVHITRGALALIRDE